MSEKAEGRVLATLGKMVPPGIAAKLLAAGFTSIRHVKEASDEELLAVQGIGPGMLRQIRDWTVGG